MTTPDAHEVEDGFIVRLGRAMSGVTDRLLLASALVVMVLLQFLIAVEVFNATQLHELATIFEFGFVTIGAFEIAPFFILLWLFKPYLSVMLDVAVEAIKGGRA